MGLFSNFPYTNFHNLNLDWVLKTVQKLKGETDANNTAISNTLNEINSRLIPTGGSEGEVLTKSGNGTASWETNVSVPAGGSIGQVLTKSSNENYAVEWSESATGLPEGGTTGQVLTKSSDENYAVEWAESGSGLPEGGAPGQTIIYGADGPEWSDANYLRTTGGIVTGPVTFPQELDFSGDVPVITSFGSVNFKFKNNTNDYGEASISGGGPNAFGGTLSSINMRAGGVNITSDSDPNLLRINSSDYSSYAQISGFGAYYAQSFNGTASLLPSRLALTGPEDANTPGAISVSGSGVNTTMNIEVPKLILSTSAISTATNNARINIPTDDENVEVYDGRLRVFAPVNVDGVYMGDITTSIRGGNVSTGVGNVSATLHSDYGATSGLVLENGDSNFSIEMFEGSAQINSNGSIIFNVVPKSINAPVADNDLVNKTYVDGLIAALRAELGG